VGHRRYTLLQQRNLIKTLQPMPRNVPHPYTRDPFKLFDEILEERAKGTAPKLHAIIEDDE